MTTNRITSSAQVRSNGVTCSGSAAPLGEPMGGLMLSNWVTTLQKEPKEYVADEHRSIGCVLGMAALSVLARVGGEGMGTLEAEESSELDPAADTRDTHDLLGAGGDSPELYSRDLRTKLPPGVLNTISSRSQRQARNLQTAIRGMRTVRRAAERGGRPVRFWTAINLL